MTEPRVADIVRARAGRLMWIVPLTLAEVAFDGGLTLSYKYLIDNVLGAGRGAMLLPVFVGLAVGLVVTSLLSSLRDWLYAGEVTATLDALRRSAFDHCQRLSMRFFTTQSSSDLLARFSTDLAGLENALASGISGMLLPALHVLVGTCLLFFVLDWKLALIGTVLWPVVLLGPRIFAPRAARASYEKKTREAKLLATIDQSLRGHRIIKAYGLEPLMRTWMRRDMGALATSNTRAGFLGALVERSTVVTIYAMQVLVVVVGAYMAYRGTITVGVLVSFVTIFWNLGWSLVVLGRATPLLVAASGSARRIDELLAEEPDRCSEGDESEQPALADAIRFEGVTFGYDKRVALLNVSIEIKHGQSVAFVGPSGSGKSTMLHLLARFDDPQHGKITFDGVDIKGVGSRALRAQMGFVLQDTILFDTSVRENIRVGRAEATDDEIEAAARAAEIHDVIAAMPEGYDSAVGERGGRLSGGQRQRIAIACALLRDPSILVLDEATSALDPATEAAIIATLEKAREGRTVVSVTHRLSTVTDADQIFVLTDGRVVEKGTHAQLLETGRVYRDLWNKQQGIVVSDDGLSAEITVERLRAIALFRPLDDAQLTTLSRRLVCERVAAGHTIVREGDAGALFYIVARGTVSIQRPSKTGKLGEITRLGDGDQFGELALLEDTPRTATIVAVNDCLLLTLTRAHFLEMLASTPAVRSAVDKIAAERRAEIARTPLAATMQ